MILHFMGYSLAIGTLAALGARLVEQALIGVRSARRLAYIGVSAQRCWRRRSCSSSTNPFHAPCRGFSCKL
jgi:hypothetical protein